MLLLKTPVINLRQLLSLILTQSSVAGVIIIDATLVSGLSGAKQINTYTAYFGSGSESVTLAALDFGYMVNTGNALINALLL